MKRSNILMLMAVLLFSACKKSGNDTTKPQTYKIVSVQENNEAPSTYTYDDKGRVSKVTNLYGYGDGTFAYSDSRITFTKESDGSTQYFNLAGGFISSNKYDIYNYDAEQFLTTRSSAQDNSVDYTLSYSGQNIVKVVSKDGRITTIDYYEGDSYQNLMGFENALYSSLLFNESTFSSFDASFTGKRSNNLVKLITTTKQIAGKTFTYKDTYTYLKDADGKVTTMTVQTEQPVTPSIIITVYKFTYSRV